MELLIQFVAQTLFFILAIFGAANAVAVLKIGEVFRGTCKEPKRFGRIPYFGKMFFCPACLAFWMGLAMSAWVLSPGSLVCAERWQSILVDGFAGSGAVWLIHVWWRTRSEPFDLKKM